MKNVRMIIFLLIISSLCTGLLTGAQQAYEKASAVFNVRLYKTILDLFEIPAGEEEITEIFSENFETREIGKRVYYISKTKEAGAVVFKADGPGLWSRIEILLAVYPDFEKLYGMRVLAQAETPGLGGRITELEFQERFSGVEIRPELRIVKFASAANEVDAITGASMTAKSLERIVNRGIREMDQAFE